MLAEGIEPSRSTHTVTPRRKNDQHLLYRQVKFILTKTIFTV